MLNKMKIVIGLGSVAAAFVVAVIILYVLQLRASSHLQDVDTLQVQLVNLIAEKSAQVLSQEDYQRVQRERLDIQDLLLRTERIYGEQELKRREGVLWIDRAANTCMITLGAANGLVSGAYLSVYDEVARPNGTIVNEKIADIIVEKTFDIVSYVNVSGKALNDFKRDYYRVAVIDAL